MEGMHVVADKHTQQGAARYDSEKTNVSVVWYEEVVEKEDRVGMTPQVCYNFCRGLKQMGFFGLLAGRQCYCAPYYTTRVGGEGDTCDMPCEGNQAVMCGGMKKSDVYEMHMCADTTQ